MEWINAKETPAPKTGTFVAWAKGRQSLAFWDNWEKCFWLASRGENEGSFQVKTDHESWITHWMPLPPPPKE